MQFSQVAGGVLVPKRREGEGRYYPRYIGLAPRQAKLATGRVFELLVTGRVVPEVASKLAGVMAEHHASLYPSGGYYVYEPGRFVWTTFADLGDSKTAIESVTAGLEGFDFVEQVECNVVGDVLFDRYLFPVLAGNGSRVVVFRLEPLLVVEQRLKEAFGTGGNSIMFEEGRNYALATLKEYEAMLPGYPPSEVLRNVVAGLRATGWGIFSFELSRLQREGTASVTIVEPPIAVKPEVHESSFTNGLVAGIVEGVSGRKVRVGASKYEPSIRTLALTLVAQ